MIFSKNKKIFIIILKLIFELTKIFYKNENLILYY